MLDKGPYVILIITKEECMTTFVSNILLIVQLLDETGWIDK